MGGSIGRGEFTKMLLVRTEACGVARLERRNPFSDGCCLPHLSSPLSGVRVFWLSEKYTERSGPSGKIKERLRPFVDVSSGVQVVDVNCGSTIQSRIRSDRSQPGCPGARLGHR